MSATAGPTRPPRGRAAQPRACLHCHEVKPPEAFDMGPSGSRRLGRCKDCIARENAEREQRAAERRATWLHPETGQTVRRCGRCQEVKPLTEEHFAYGDKAHTAHQWWCRTCGVEDRAARHKRLMQDPEYAARWRARQAVQKLAWRKRNLERARAAQKRYRDRVTADPARRAERRERQRMEYRLRQERKGRDLSQMRRKTTVSRTVETEAGGYLPTRPLVTAIEARVRLAPDATLEDVCENLDVTGRTYFAWRTGARQFVRVDVADRVIQALGLMWYDLVDEADDRAVFDAYRRAFDAEHES